MTLKDQLERRKFRLVPDSFVNEAFNLFDSQDENSELLNFLHFLNHFK